MQLPIFITKCDPAIFQLKTSMSHSYERRHLSNIQNFFKIYKHRLDHNVLQMWNTKASQKRLTFLIEIIRNRGQYLIYLFSPGTWWQSIPIELVFWDLATSGSLSPENVLRLGKYRRLQVHNSVSGHKCNFSSVFRIHSSLQHQRCRQFSK